MYTRTSSAASPPSHNPSITQTHSRSPSRTTPGRRPSPEPRPLYSPLPSTPPPRVHHHSPSRTPVKTPPSNPTPPRNSPLRTNTPPRPPTFTRVSPSRNAPPSRLSSGNINAQSSPSPSPSRRPPPPPSSSSSSSQDIIVMVRSRPYLPSERRFGKDVLRMETRNSAAITTLTDPQSRAEYPFVTNFAFQSHDRNHPLHADQAYVVSALVRPLTNCPSHPPMRASLICYGPPGTGKSMSMFGKPSSAHLAGALPAFCRAIIANSLTTSRPQIQMQALELRSDRVYDLLLDRRRWSPSGVTLKTNPSNGECSADAVWVPCPHYDSILQCIDMIERNRSTHSHPTHPRAHSGHAFVTVKVTQPSGSVYQVHFIDLAGSGRSEGNDTSVSTERAWLNQSLGSLRRMISNMSTTPSTKLAHLLQLPLSTSQPLVLLVTLAPSVEGFEDALHSLRFAEHVKRMVDSRQRSSPSSDGSLEPMISSPNSKPTTSITTTTTINTSQMDIRPPSTDLPLPPSRDSPVAKISTTSMSPKNMHSPSPPNIIQLTNNGHHELEGRNSPLFVDNVVIAVRIRPFPEKEKEESAVKPVEGGVAVTNPSTGDRHIFPAHIVFDESSSQFSHQERIYGTFASMVKDAVNNGQRISFITYGQTGSGKTHTMLGKVGSPHLEGLFPRCCQGLFSSNSNSTLLTVDLQAVEVFADQVNDLLIPRSDWPSQGCGLNTSVNNQFEASCSNFHCVHYSELRKAVEAIYQNRSLHSHQFNSEANASHLLCTLTVSVLPDGRASNGVRLSRLHFIDLGGLSGEDNQDLTDEQITGINKALVYLFQAVKALTIRRVPPFTETNLNKLMRTPLMQSERIVLLNAVNPSSNSYVETCNTLHFAQLFKNIRTSST